MNTENCTISDVAVTYELTAIRERKSFDSITDSLSVASYARNLFADSLLVSEKFYALFLNRRNEIVGNALIASGGIHSCVVDSRLIFRYAIGLLASNIIVCHNHPSGSTKPSGSDINLTKKLVEGGKLLDITVLDHLIITESTYYSFSDSGMMPY